MQIILNIKRVAFVVFFALSQSGVSYAQTAGGAGGGGDLDKLANDTKNDLLVVVGGGLAGAILGLSTLSFVEEPKEHTRNIIVGASIGIIAGVGFVAFSQANKTQSMIYGESYSTKANLSSEDFNTAARTAWHSSEKHKPALKSVWTPYQVNYTIKF
ncbi:MAG: hypothetical protein QF441_06765 [Bacteriovoracaceae bacterium]|nr:hypothetical protein [Halobacteriovoraceae bacterium]MDP7320293.1 hypothetical protein [Bacteriovoracaceae bacterium]